MAITAPDASSEDPLVIKFVIDSSLASTSLGGPGIFRDGQKVPRCDSVAPAGTASPDPCVSERQPQENGNLEITVLASKAFVASTTAASQPVAAGDTVSTGGGSTPTADNPVITSVTSPNAGQVSIAEDPTITQHPPSSAYTFFGQEIHITAPDATIENPLVLRFEFDASVVPSSGGTIVLLRNGELVLDCTDPASESATPNPCVYKQETLSDGTIEIGVYTSQASLWAAAVLRRYDFEGFFPPWTTPPTRSTRPRPAAPSP